MSWIADFLKNHKIEFHLGPKYLYVIIAIMLVTSTITITVINGKANKIESYTREIETHVMSIYEENVALREKINGINTPGIMQRIAEEDLNMMYEDSIIFEFVE